jgi:hypothetical protein
MLSEASWLSGFMGTNKTNNLPSQRDDEKVMDYIYTYINN